MPAPVARPVRTVPPRHGWQVPLAADTLVCAALARGWRTALGNRLEVRRDGMPDDDVVAAVVVAFRASYRRREKSARAELPHF